MEPGAAIHTATTAVHLLDTFGDIIYGLILQLLVQ